MFHNTIARRGFLQTAALGATAFAADMSTLSVLSQPLLAAELKRQQKHVILLWLAGGPSQLETWDPKPGRPTGGPFRAIDTGRRSLAVRYGTGTRSRRAKRRAHAIGANCRERSGDEIHHEPLAAPDLVEKLENASRRGVEFGRGLPDARRPARRDENHPA